ncbi:3-hydroxyacyl-ACP dehydratase FabZ family protein [Wenjunlia tyrosinilytica]|uniref:ApeI dehydratase-like domain-containing protein n=1 Tax=Wenjunlia tyrosinilytica TaxID=1544741 RepID=A0A918DS47_9ACTN|nr:hypothetical protein [Wenjunlia tyrosinilytica]GGO79919.1 hypothetical protein GCM10012280_00560 [Wenjunlia tyrosinilytica]
MTSASSASGAALAAPGTDPAGGTAAPPPRRRAAPHNPVDSASVLSSTEVVARKAVRADDAYLEGHYPDMTVYPGVFLIESVHEAVIHFVRQVRGEGVVPEPAVLESVRFTTALRPGDVLDVHCECRPGEGDTLLVTALCTSGGARAAQMKIQFRLVADTAETGDPCTTTRPSAA